MTKNPIRDGGAWLTNDVAVAKRLKIIDRAYVRACKKAEKWTLRGKLHWHAKCLAERNEAYGRVIASLTAEQELSLTIQKEGVL